MTKRLIGASALLILGAATTAAGQQKARLRPAETAPLRPAKRVAAPVALAPPVAPKPAATRPDTARLQLGGLWKGPLKVLGGQLDLTISVVPLAGGAYFAALDVPAQRVSRLATEVQVRGDSVLLTMPEADSRYRARYEADSNQLAGTWTRAGVATPVRLRHWPMPQAEAGANRLTPPYREEDVVFSNPASRQLLHGTFSVPAGPGPFPAVVLVADAGPQLRDGAVGGYRLLGALADYLTRRGVAVLRFDDPGSGPAGGGPPQAGTLAQRTADAQAALNFLRTRLEIKINRIGVVGHGEGANVALLAASQALPPAFVVALAPYGRPGQQTLLQQYVASLKAKSTDPATVAARYDRQRTMYDIIRQSSPQQAAAIVANMLRQDDAALDPAAARTAAAAFLSPARRAFLNFDPIATLDQVACPVLLMAGTLDTETPADQHLTPLEKELKSVNRNVVARRVAGANHLFQPPPAEWTMLDGEMKPIFSPAAQEAMREWIVGLK